MYVVIDIYAIYTFKNEVSLESRQQRAHDVVCGFLIEHFVMVTCLGVWFLGLTWSGLTLYPRLMNEGVPIGLCIGRWFIISFYAVFYLVCKSAGLIVWMTCLNILNIILKFVLVHPSSEVLITFWKLELLKSIILEEFRSIYILSIVYIFLQQLLCE